MQDPVEKLLSGLPADISRELAPLVGAELRTVVELRTEVEHYLNHLEGESPHAEFLDLHMAREVAVRCEKILDRLGEDPPEDRHRLVQVACRYFVLEDDAESDSESLIGFDDDLAVLEAVERLLDGKDE